MRHNYADLFSDSAEDKAMLVPPMTFTDAVCWQTLENHLPSRHILVEKRASCSTQNNYNSIRYDTIPFVRNDSDATGLMG